MKQHLPALALVAIAAMIAAVACSPNEPGPTPEARRQARIERDKAKLDQPPGTRTYSMPNGQLTVLDVPAASPTGSVEYQRCMLWRDAEFKTATLSCPQPSSLDPSP